MLAIAFAGAVAACGIPLKVTLLGEQGDAAKAQSGVRLRLARPSFHLLLAMEEKDKRRLVVTQTMDDAPLVFQAETSPNWLADTEVTISVDGMEMLTSASAGETDRTKDVIESALAVAGAAAKTRAKPRVFECDGADRLGKEVSDFDNEQNALIAARNRARDALNQCLLKKQNCSSYNAELTRRTQDVEQNRLSLDDYSEIVLEADPNHPLLAPRVPTPCFRVVLEEEL